MSILEVESLKEEYAYYSGVLRNLYGNNATQKINRKLIGTVSQNVLSLRKHAHSHKSRLILQGNGTISSPFKFGNRKSKVQDYRYRPQLHDMNSYKTNVPFHPYVKSRNVTNLMLGNADFQHLYSNAPKTFNPRPFVGKYALKRAQADSSTRNVSINKVLGRRVGNLSKNKYKFVNAHLKLKNKSKPRTPVPNLLKGKFVQGRPSLSTSLKKHLASRLVSRSSRLLARQKSSKFCLFFNKFGRCHRGTKCHDIHDPDKISVCTRFLRGTCNISNCPFSHKILKEKMPTCTYFLRGLCLRSDCPYSHVNVGRNAEVCQAFIDGHCSLGNECKKKHVYLCPDYSVKGCCPRDPCPMHHVLGKNIRPLLEKESSEHEPDKFPNSGSKSARDIQNFISLDLSVDDHSGSCDSSFFSDVESWSILPKLKVSK